MEVTPVDHRRWGLGDVALGLALGQAFAIVATVVALGIGGWEPDGIPLWAGALLQVPLWAGWLVAVALAGRKGDGVVPDFRVTARWPDLPVGLAIGVAVQVVVVPLLYLPVLRLLDLTSDDLSAPARELSEKAQGTWGWILLAFLVVVGAPLAEELFYRGLMLQALRKRGLPDWAACVTSGVVFALMHFQALQFLGLFVLGTVLAAMVVRTDRLGPAVTAHAAFNAATVVILYLGSR
ncbi:MAG: CPBP family intramembrane metalloprotease [Acidobacteria bacterium]|nr:CPBP family intramembrane metalloprotease [Acidobacteriota bacterium]